MPSNIKIRVDFDRAILKNGTPLAARAVEFDSTICRKTADESVLLRKTCWEDHCEQGDEEGQNMTCGGRECTGERERANLVKCFRSGYDDT